MSPTPIDRDVSYEPEESDKQRPSFKVADVECYTPDNNRREVEAVTGPLLNQEHDSDDESVSETLYEQVTSVMNGVTDALCKVVSELQSLSQQKDNTNVGSSNQEPAMRSRDERVGVRFDPHTLDNDGPSRASFERHYHPAQRYNSSRNANVPVNAGDDRMYPDEEYNGSRWPGDHQQQYAERPWLRYRESNAEHQQRRFGNAKSNDAFSKNIKIPPFTGKENWAVWLAKFEVIANRCGWSEDDKLDSLLPRIEGQASEFVFSQLPPAVLENYYDLTSEMTRRYRVIETSRSFAAKFTRRNQRSGETAEDFAADLKRLYDKAHKHRDRRIRDEDLVRRFLDGLLDQEAKFEVEYHKEPSNIDEAVFHVVNLIQTRNSCKPDRYHKQQIRKTFYDDASDVEESDACWVRRAEGKKNVVEGQDNSETKDALQSVKDMMQQLMKRVVKLEETKDDQGRRPSYNRQDIKCFNCHEMGHFARACPKKHNGPRDDPGSKRPSIHPLNSQGPSLVPRERSE